MSQAPTNTQNPNSPAPPLDVEEALDLILACAAHTSRQEGQQRFGQLLFDEFLVKLRAEQTDPRSRAYMTHLLPIVASAVRAFAVEREVFGERWASLQKAHQERLQYVDGWVGYSPLNASGVLYRLAGPAVLLSLASWLMRTMQPERQMWVWGALGGAALGYLLVDILLKALRHHIVGSLYRELPGDIDEAWAKSLAKYRDILTNFLLLAIKVRERFYPELPSVSLEPGKPLYQTYDIPHIPFAAPPCDRPVLPEDILEHLRRIVDRHLSFGKRPLESGQSNADERTPSR